MLPTLEFLRSEPCPFFRAGLCDRPHCPFRHSSSDRDKTPKVIEKKDKLITPVKSKKESKTKSSIPGEKRKNKDQKEVTVERVEKKEVEDEENAERKRLEEEYERMILGEDESDDDIVIDPEIAEQFLMPEDTDEDPNELMDACYKEWLRSRQSTNQEANKNETNKKESLLVNQIKTPEPTSAKKRIAHPTADSSRSPKVASPRNPKLTPSQCLQNRYEWAKNAISNQSQSEPKHETVGMGDLELGNKRISHDPKLGLMTMSFRKKIEAETTEKGYLPRLGSQFPYTQFPCPTTVPHSPQKGLTRKAHSPIQAPPRSPVISKDSLAISKIPFNSRQQTLSQLHKACGNIYNNNTEASDRALKEELALATKHKNKQVYIGASANCLKRLRDEAKIQQDKHPVTRNVSEKHSSMNTKVVVTAKSTSNLKTTAAMSTITATATTSTAATLTAAISTNSSQLRSPTQSHQSILSSRKKCSWSIETKKTAEFPVKEKLYQAMKIYLLTTQQLSDNGYPMSHPSGDRGRVTTENRLNNKTTPQRDSTQRVCDRCRQIFLVGLDGIPVIWSQCMYHPGRSFKRRVSVGLFEERYNCCDGESSSPGCAVANVHVSVHPSQEIYGFVTAIKENGNEETMGNDPWDIVAIDCEMVYTTYGCELARATFVSSEKDVLYDELVKPIHPIIDYNTRFSGITAEMMEKVTTSLTDVQAVMLTRFRPNSILIGHSLDSDLLALKLKHDCIIDTSVIMPHRRGLPFKRALRSIASDCLGKIIQNGETGHDSHEDAVSALEVVLWKINGDSRYEPKRIKYS